MGIFAAYNKRPTVNNTCYVAETAAVTVVVSAAETVAVTEVLDQSGMLSHKRMHQPQSSTLKKAMACQRPASVHVADT